MTINPGRGVLVMANLVSARFASEYAFYEEMQGGAYYETEGGWVQNPRYEGAALRVVPAGSGFGDLYDLVRCRGDVLSCLNRPEDFEIE